MPTSTDEETFTYDPEAARRGWEATADLRAAVDFAPLPLLPIPRVAILGLSVARLLKEPEVRGEFELLHPKHFDPAILERLEDEAWALWYANDTVFLQELTSEGAKLSVETLTLASEIRERMLALCMFMLRKHPIGRRIVDEIRSGQGYADLASDLTRLARLYTTYESIVSKAGESYDPNDVDAANGTAAQIVLELGENDEDEVKKAKAEAGRAFAVLEHDYDAVRRWATAIWDDEDFIPSLYSVRGSGRSSSTKTAAPAEGTGGSTADATETD